MTRWSTVQDLQRRLAAEPEWIAVGDTVMVKEQNSPMKVHSRCRDEQAARLIVDMRRETGYIVNLLIEVRRKEEDMNRERRYNLKGQAGDAT